MDVDRYRPLDNRRRLLILLLAVATALGVLWLLVERRGSIEPDPRVLAPDKAPCAAGITTACVGGTAQVIVVPQQGVAASR
jgi:hypothetical protein